MSLKEKLADDFKAALKNKDNIRKSVITMIRAAIKQYEVDNKVEIDDDKIIEIISKQVKQKRDAIVEFNKGNRQDLVDETNNEIQILMEYLPKQLTEEEVREIVNESINKLNAQGPKDMGKVMQDVMPKVKGKADGKLVSSIVKELLN